MESSLDLAHLEVLVEDLLLDVVDVPDADSIVVNGHEVVGRVVVEADLVGYMHADRVAADRLTSIALIHNSRFISLESSRHKL